MSVCLSVCLYGIPHTQASNTDLLNLVLYEPDITSTPFGDEKIITYDIELPTSGKKVGFNLLDNEYFAITYITDTTTNSLAGHQPPSQANINVWIVAINGEEPITYQGVLDELNHHKTPRVKSMIKISLCRRKSHQRKKFEEILSRFDQVRPVVSHLEFHIPMKSPTPKNIGEGLSGTQRQ